METSVWTRVHAVHFVHRAEGCARFLLEEPDEQGVTTENRAHRSLAMIGRGKKIMGGRVKTDEIEGVGLWLAASFLVARGSGG